MSHLEIALKNFQGIAKANTAFESTNNGEFVSGGVKGMPTMLRSWIIIRRFSYEQEEV